MKVYDANLDGVKYLNKVMKVLIDSVRYIDGYDFVVLKENQYAEMDTKAFKSLKRVKGGKDVTRYVQSKHYNKC